MERKATILIYIAGKYSGDVNANIAEARKWAIKLWEAGHAVICPHLNTAHMEIDCKATYEDFLRGDFVMIARCDAVFMLPGWEQSDGAKQEHKHAWTNGIPVIYSDLTDVEDIEKYVKGLK